MGYFERIKNGWRIAKKSLAIVRENKSLLGITLLIPVNRVLLSCGYLALANEKGLNCYKEGQLLPIADDVVVTP